MPLRRSNVDTDQIIPAVWLKQVSRTGFEKGLFAAWREDPGFVLNVPVYQGASILVSGPDFGDRLVEGGGFPASGHLGDAYGLFATFAFDRATKNGFIFLVGGTGFDPERERGAYSSASRFEERIATALYRRAIQGKAD